MLLKLAFSNGKEFGGIPVLFAGDFQQLPPVLQKPLYSPDKELNEPEDLLGRMLWSSIKVVFILTDVVRQKERQFIDILNRV